MSDGAKDAADARPETGAPGRDAVRVRSGSWWQSAPVWFWFFSVLFATAAWWPLVASPRSGLQGGDTFTYFFPLKSWYAERLRAGELPLWNPLIGHGMPALGESQTGVFYPFNLLFYRFLPLGVAYSANFLLHYVLAFGFTCHYARRLGLSFVASLLAGVIFVYGWFPTRSCLEWAIVTGAWTPLALWGVEGFLATGRRRWLVAMQLAVVMQLLAGHFNLAFITLLAISLYVPLRMFFERRAAGEWTSGVSHVGVTLVLACGLAAIQLVPSWELKGRSQRGDADFGEQKIGYGSIPWSYLPQVIQPWRFYPHVNEPAFDRRFFGGENTNKVEAHLYFGLVPMALAALAIVWAAIESLSSANRARLGVVWVWLIVGGMCFGLVTGWWTRWAAHVPGFGYFTGPGRYGVLVQLAVAVLAGFGIQLVREFIRGISLRWPRFACVAVTALVAVVPYGAERWTSWAGGFEAFAASLPFARAGWSAPTALAVAVVLFAGFAVVALRRDAVDLPVAAICLVATWVDLALACRAVQYAEIRPISPIHVREQSVVAEILRRARADARVLARNQNAVSLCGVATTPPYLGIGPREYFDGPLRLPADFHWEREFSPLMRQWLAWSGVTHVLAFDEMADESLELVWAGHDPFLHDLLGRPPWEPLWLYAFRPARGRAYLVSTDEAAQALDPTSGQFSRIVQIHDVHVSANRIEMTVDCDADSVVVLTDLNFPGWHVTVDDRPSGPVADSIFRAVRVGAGRHQIQWVYRPRSLWIGLLVSLVSVIGTCALVRVRRPRSSP